VRLPDGLKGQRFFQRHGMKGMDLPTIKIAGDKQPYVTLESAEDLQALAQAAALELHPWGCRPNEPEIPDRLIFDLDPDEGLDFGDVVDAAKTLRGPAGGGSGRGQRHPVVSGAVVVGRARNGHARGRRSSDRRHRVSGGAGTDGPGR
ncbi:MAG TPA: hypothetical protein VF178_06505, partial [Gemmatimonadaceae bacterium]